MDKPTIFFSHSSIDRDYISELQRGVNERTSGTVNIFQSSDGESIPFGNNWVHKIEENLHKAKIMFVFVSPESLASSWIYFESGFAYAKNVKVIPIGIKGVDIGKLRPPLNLLQGFNLVSEAGMNNIISILNNTFQCSFSTSFNANDYAKIAIFDEGSKLNENGVLDKVDFIKISFPNSLITKDNDPSGKYVLVDDAVIEFQKKINKLGVQSAFSSKDKLHAHGLIAFIDHQTHQFSVKIDPYMLKTYEELINNVFDGMYNNYSPEYCWFDVILNSSVFMETTDFKVSSKLFQESVGLLGENGSYYGFNDIKFTIVPAENPFNKEGKEKISVIYSMGNFQVPKLVDLLNVLAKTKVVV
ncbi:toll/interleukin-1 receptor domain-containing protein [Aeromonas sanarellii]|uniref:toll/interleukin-1 receptor domain-containing protein n=1 Tax=Aeromonas sanarellii TaxID=633415 RepID=UPI0038D07A41